MANEKPSWRRLDQQLRLEPITSGQRTIQPVAQLTGWQWINAQATASSGGVLVCIQPLAVIVRQDGVEHTIPIVDPLRAALRALSLTGLFISLGCWFVMLIVQRRARRRE
jgi:hypothetical protein